MWHNSEFSVLYHLFLVFYRWSTCRDYRGGGAKSMADVAGSRWLACLQRPSSLPSSTGSQRQYGKGPLRWTPCLSLLGPAPLPKPCCRTGWLGPEGVLWLPASLLIWSKRWKTSNTVRPSNWRAVETPCWACDLQISAQWGDHTHHYPRRLEKLELGLHQASPQTSYPSNNLVRIQLPFPWFSCPRTPRGSTKHRFPSTWKQNAPIWYSMR